LTKPIGTFLLISLSERLGPTATQQTVSARCAVRPPPSLAFSLITSLYVQLHRWHRQARRAQPSPSSRSVRRLVKVLFDVLHTYLSFCCYRICIFDVISRATGQLLDVVCLSAS